MLASAVRRFVATNHLASWIKARTPDAVRQFIGNQILPLPAAVDQPFEARPAESAQRVVKTLAEIDAIMLELDAAAAVSDDELRRVFKTFRMEFPLTPEVDPASDAYRAQQFQFYEWLHGRPYSVKNEVSSFDVAQAVAKPFPYSTESPDTVGNQLISIGYIIKKLALPPHSRVLEFGPGWGNTTVALARMGHQVTAIEIERNFVELITERARRKGIEVAAICGDFFDCQKLTTQFDAVLFYECFHHCSDHRALIRALDRLVAPGGQIMFAAEPILEEFHLPWGLRVDGESLWAIRRLGWLELGFKESYFRKLMDDNGWALRKEVATDTPWGTLFIATRKD